MKRTGPSDKAHPDQGRAPHANSRKHTSGSIKGYLLLFGLLCSGTTVALVSQVIVNQAATHPGAQLQTLSKYSFTFLISLASGMLGRLARAAPKPPSTAPSAKKEPTPIWAHVAVISIGILDVLAYSLYVLGCAACGSAFALVIMAAVGQLCSAVLSVTLLKRQLRRQHLAAVGLVAVSLVLRSGGRIFGGGLAAASSSSSAPGGYSQMQGALLVGAAAVFYSSLGVLYEYMMTKHSGGYTHTQVGFLTSTIGLLAVLSYQLLYTWPNRKQLLLQPLASSSTVPSAVVMSHLVYGAVYTLHFYLQAFVLQLQGALAVGVVNGCRATVVSFVSHALFCSLGPQHCLTRWLAGSAVVVTAGAVCWVRAGKPLQGGEARAAAAAKKEL